MSKCYVKPSTNFEIQKCYQSGLNFNGDYSRIDLSKIKIYHI